MSQEIQLLNLVLPKLSSEITSRHGGSEGQGFLRGEPFYQMKPRGLRVNWRNTWDGQRMSKASAEPAPGLTALCAMTPVCALGVRG